MDKIERNWITIREFELCYPLEYLEYLETFELNNKKCVLLDENAMNKIDLLIKKDEEYKTQKFNNRIEIPKLKRKKNYDFNSFLNQVRTGNFSKIEIENYIYKLSKKHKFDKLKTILKDIDFYLFAEKDFKLAEITPEMWAEKHKYYNDKGEETPFKTRENLLRTLNKSYEVINKPEYYNYYDEESLFFPHEFFCIYTLKNYIKRLIENPENISTKHESVFSNNGFILFDYILKEYIKPINKRGRLSDIHFFYWSMYNNEPKFIHQRPESFKKWFSDNYDKEDLGKFKTYDAVKNSDRLKHYSNAIDWFRHQSQYVP